MRKVIAHLAFGVMLAGVAISCSQKSNIFVLEGRVSQETSDSAYNVIVRNKNFEGGQESFGEVVVVKDQKFRFETQIDYPASIWLYPIKPGNQSSQVCISFILVPGETARVTVHDGSFDLDGSKFYNEWHRMSEFYDQNVARIRELGKQVHNQEQPFDEKAHKEYMAAKDLLSQNLIGYLKQHNNEVGAIIFASQRGLAYSNILFDSIAAPEIKTGLFRNYIEQRLKYQADDDKQRLKSEEAYKKRMEEVAERRKATDVGTMFKDFAVEYGGKTEKLSDYVGKGQYVLVDFWASWCGPCRAVIPNLINVYDKYKGKKFKMLGVTVDDAPEDSEDAISVLGIKYPQMLNADDSCARIYGINEIPHIILFGPDGTILARDLHGEMIEITVKQHLGL